jgi:carbon storage regulator CsrA
VLVLKHRVGNVLTIGDVKITLIEGGANSVTLGIDAPRDVPVGRSEARRNREATPAEQADPDGCDHSWRDEKGGLERRCCRCGLREGKGG